MPGRAGLDWLVHPEEIGGVEIYSNPAEIPARLANWPDATGQLRACGAIIFWTREKLGLPKATRADPP